MPEQNVGNVRCVIVIFGEVCVPSRNYVGHNVILCEMIVDVFLDDSIILHLDVKLLWTPHLSILSLADRVSIRRKRVFGCRELPYFF